MIGKLAIVAGILWASPWTMVGLSLGTFALLRGGKVQRTGRVIEFHGPLLAWLLRIVPIRGGASAMTLGHVVIAADATQLARTRAHERVHVGQYERWGLFFVPAYFLLAALVLLKGHDPYLDNPFEREAYAVADSQTELGGNRPG